MRPISNNFGKDRYHQKNRLDDLTIIQLSDVLNLPCWAIRQKTTNFLTKKVRRIALLAGKRHEKGENNSDLIKKLCKLEVKVIENSVKTYSRRWK